MWCRPPMRSTCYLAAAVAATASTSTPLLAVVIPPGGSATLPFDLGVPIMEIDLGTANPTGQVIISERDATNTLLTRMTLDLDGTLLGSPSWVIELVDQNNNIFSFNGLFVNQLFPLDVLLETTPEGFALARHKTVELGDLWFWDFGNGYQGVRDHITGDYWKIQPKGDEHVTGGPLTLDFSPNNFFIENLTLDFINVQQIPEPATLILLALGGLIGRRRRR